MAKPTKPNRNPKSNPKWCVGIIPDTLKTKSQTYCPELARFPGDPEANVESRSQIKDLARRRGWRVQGIVDADYLQVDNSQTVEIQQKLRTLRDELYAHLCRSD